MSSVDDAIREYAGHSIDRARRVGLSEASILARQVAREMHLNNLVPTICSALASKQFQEDNDIVLEAQDGLPIGTSTTMRFTYRLNESSVGNESEPSAFLALRGAGKSVFEALGGGENFIKSERGALPTGPGEPESGALEEHPAQPSTATRPVKLASYTFRIPENQLEELRNIASADDKTMGNLAEEAFMVFIENWVRVNGEVRNRKNPRLKSGPKIQ